MKYCKRCVLPDSRPGIVLDADGVCTACRGHDEKLRKIDWAERQRKFKDIVERAKSRSAGYDCIVPVSGGKDSWYQVIKCQEMGMHVLAVTWRTPARTEVGQRNLERLVSCLGVDHIDYTINPEVERRFMKAAYERKGATGLPMHMALFAIPIRLAMQLGIPLVVWGENAQLEFGGTEEERLSLNLDRAWLAKHGCLQSTAAKDWIGVNGLTAKNLAVYELPEEGAAASEPESIFLGAFFPWNSFENVQIATEHGFQSAESFRKVGVWEFADIDCDFISLHHFLKWYKFGITRAFDNLSVQIRYGLTTREEAIEQIRNLGPQIPSSDIKRFCEFVGEPESWFWEVAEGFRNREIWERRGNAWVIPGFLIEDWAW